MHLPIHHITVEQIRSWKERFESGENIKTILPEFSAHPYEKQHSFLHLKMGNLSAIAYAPIDGDIHLTFKDGIENVSLSGICDSDEGMIVHDPIEFFDILVKMCHHPRNRTASTQKKSL